MGDVEGGGRERGGGVEEKEATSRTVEQKREETWVHKSRRIAAITTNFSCYASGI